MRRIAMWSEQPLKPRNADESDAAQATRITSVREERMWKLTQEAAEQPAKGLVNLITDTRMLAFLQRAWAYFAHYRHLSAFKVSHLIDLIGSWGGVSALLSGTHYRCSLTCTHNSYMFMLLPSHWI